jgi:hypothetical protein
MATEITNLERPVKINGVLITPQLIEKVRLLKQEGYAERIRAHLNETAMLLTT